MWTRCPVTTSPSSISTPNSPGPSGVTLTSVTASGCHRRRVRRLDLDDDALVIGLVVRVRTLAHVALGEVIDEGPIRIVLDLVHHTAHLEVPVGVVGVGDRQRDVR